MSFNLHYVTKVQIPFLGNAYRYDYINQVNHLKKKSKQETLDLESITSIVSVLFDNLRGQ